MSCTCANWSAQSPEVGILNEVTYAGSLPYASATLHCMRPRGRGISLNATGANFSARWTIVWRNPARGSDVVFTKLKIARRPNAGTRNTIKANARCFTVVLAITQYWHTKFRHVRYV